MEDRDFFWLVGLLEGEGCFAYSGMSSPLVHLQMTDEDVVRRAALLMEAKKVSYREDPGGKGNKPAWIARIYGDVAINLMQRVLPYMGRRRAEKIKSILAWSEARPGVFKKLNQEKANSIRQEYADGALQKDLAEKYGVSQSLVSLVARGEAWL